MRRSSEGGIGGNAVAMAMALLILVASQIGSRAMMLETQPPAVRLAA
jgi:hypothetical protein